MNLSYLASLSHYVPELMAVLTMVMLVFIESSYGRNDKKRSFFYFGTFIGLGFVLLSLFDSYNDHSTAIFTGSMVIDPFSSLVKIILVVGTMASIYLAKESKDIYGHLKPEFAIMSIGVLIGGMILCSANNFLMLYIGIETLSILSYVLASFKKNDEMSSEAGLKYSLYGGVSAGVMLFGMSHIFGVLGTIQFSGVSARLLELPTTDIVILLPAFLMFFAGVGYKIAAVPFHMWAPDVYEGSPIPVTTFFSIVPKVAGIAVLVRVSMIFFGSPGALQVTWVGILSVVAALTMTVGNVSAIGQKSVKRMLAYSSISHAGVMMLGVLVINELGVQSVLFYAVTYLFMTLVAFYIVTFVSDKYGNDHFDRFRGLIVRYPLMTVIMAMVMFSLAGVPPLSGFVAKFNIFGALVSKKYYTLAVIAGINSVVSLYYYLKLVRLMIFKEQESNEVIVGFGTANQTLIVAMAIPVLMLGIFWSKLMELTDGAVLFIAP
ncbi:MAG: NADH-quinone oxidoreductase subunit N [Bacteriovoracaceae bacterium]|jgi:NADH-quinone oxidoreductase subunit N|nr:NADH-quinone oxidoreductase subunit N [Bacteriovoracaceae bacterium]